MLHDSGLPSSLWAECVCHAVWLKNRTSTRVLGGKTLFEVAFGQKPNIANVPDWGSEVFVQKRSKLKLLARARIGRWVGYNDGLESVEVSKGHRVYWKDTRTVTVERGVIFRKEEGGIRGFIEVEEEGVEVGIEGEGSRNNPNNPANVHIANSPTSPETPRSESLEPVRQPRVRNYHNTFNVCSMALEPLGPATPYLAE
ncbi:hypothetical protein BT96DRAFT_843188 [Gymnopus androsaceus JB14]|uniref:Retroviral polymerase SH3-like domain-containing protein n=1 Tax=Gymnopus androsaceus JB14 TaxID=1447944 RepID=A0A6A4GEA8_9AGAR|nr:hypothetical protein BT96DRAFT_843188 [Gymnopus androsaceus JB14]